MMANNQADDQHVPDQHRYWCACGNPLPGGAATCGACRRTDTHQER
ncbi:MAG: hypothetical protein ACRDQX_10965 [Pseudonocardiaceae bacterium]